MFYFLVCFSLGRGHLVPENKVPRFVEVTMSGAILSCLRLGGENQPRSVWINLNKLRHPPLSDSTADTSKDAGTVRVGIEITL